MRYTQKDIRQKLGFTRDALRLYEKRGIIQPEIDPGNGYRYYDDWQMNLLWDCKYYQAMGFSLAEVQELLTARTPGDIESQLARREEEMRHDLRRRELALSEHSRFMEELRSSESDLGVVEERDFAGCIYVVEREEHRLPADICTDAVAFANRNAALMKPYFWFPVAGERRYFLGGRPCGSRRIGNWVRNAGARTLWSLHRRGRSRRCSTPVTAAGLGPTSFPAS